jgi:hypothetical protein
MQLPERRLVKIKDLPNLVLILHLLCQKKHQY